MPKFRLAELALDHSENRGVLAYLGRPERARFGPIARPSSVPDPYRGCGSHPDIVERVWDDLGRDLPRASRALVYGNPALVHATAGLVLAVALGTQYALRLPRARHDEAARAAMKSVHLYRTSGVTLDLGQWGPSWRFGTWGAREREWLQELYAELGREVPGENGPRGT